MSIWILAIVLLALLALIGWQQGGVLAAFSFVGIVFGALLAGLAGKLFHPLLPHLGASDPIVAWIAAPICGFLLIEIIFTAIGFKVTRQVEVHYKHRASELQLGLWTRLNSRLGICVGILNGAAYFVLISFVIFNLTYLTGQVAVAPDQSFLIRAANRMGQDLESTGAARAAAGVGTLPPFYYQIADVSGFLMQNPQAGTRLANYPGFTSLWQRDDMQPLVNDGDLTNALASGATIGTILGEQQVQDFLKNKDLTKAVSDTFLTNLDDLTNYLVTGQSAKYNDKMIGQWQFNANATYAWYRQDHPRSAAGELKAARAILIQGYNQTMVLATGDGQLFLKSWPHFQLQGTQTSVQPQDWKGDWSADGANYSLHTSMNGEDKYFEGKVNGLRLSVKDGKELLIFDRLN